MADIPFAVTHATWIKTETDRIGEIILTPRFRGRAWTHKRLQRELADIGLEYTIAQIAELTDDLHKRGVVEDVTDIGPTPVPVEAPVIVEPSATSVIVK